MSDVSDLTIQFEAVKTSLSQSKAGMILRLAIHPDDMPRQLLTDWVGARYQVVMVRLDEDDQPTASQDTVDAARAVKSAGMLCRNEQFQQYLYTLGYAEEVSEEEAISGLRSILGITSRAEMKSNPDALEAFRKVRSGFQEWREKLPAADRRDTTQGSIDSEF